MLGYRVPALPRFTRVRAVLGLLGVVVTTLLGVVHQPEVAAAAGSTCGSTNVAVGSVATASSVSGGQKADKAVDGKTNSRWTSALSDPQWLQLDLGSRQNVCKVGLDWAAYASSFSIQASDDSNRWTTLLSTVASSNSLQTVTVFGSGRYIRMYGTARGVTSSGYSLNEFQVFTQPSQAPAFTSPATATFQVGIPGSFSVTTSGVPAAALIETGSLPAGVTFTDHGDGTAILQGTPTGTGNTYPVTLSAANGVAPNATQNLTIQVNQPPSISLNPVGQTVQPGTSVSFLVASTGVPTPTVHWQVSTDHGASFADISGATSTTYTFVAQLSQNGNSYRAVFSNGVGSAATTTAASLGVGIAPAFTSADHTSLVVGSADSFRITATGVPSATLGRTGTQFPAWLTLTDNGDGTGELTGTPPAGSAGTYQFTLTAANGFSPFASQVFTLYVDDSPVITSVDHTTFTAGQAGSFAVTTTAGFPTLTALSEAGSLPSGVTFHNNGDGTATLAGTPAPGTGGTYFITITAAASGGRAAPATQSFTLTVLASPTITSTDHATFFEDSTGSFTVTTTAGNPIPITLTSTGTLPWSVSFTDNGDGTATLTGTPDVDNGGVYAITITASNGITPDATQTFTLTVAVSPRITSADHATFAAVNAAAAFTVTTTGTPTPLISETGGLPPGVTFTDNGDGTATLGGTPTAGGSYPITITASNGVIADAVQALTLDVKPFVVTPRGRVAVSMASLDSSGAPGGSGTRDPQVSSNGRFVFFISSDLTLDPRFTPKAGPVLYVRDQEAGTTHLASLGKDNLPIPGGVFNSSFAISENGNAVAFYWKDSTTEQTIVRDLSVGISRSVPGAPRGPKLNGDGSVVAFSDDTDTNTTLLDLSTGQTQHIPHSLSLFSADGNNIIYSLNGVPWEYNIPTDTATAVSVDQAGIPRPGGASSVSADGRWVAFTSTSQITSADPSGCSPTQNCPQLYRRDMLRQVSDVVASPAQPAYSYCPTRGRYLISDDGQRITFSSDCAPLGGRDTYDYQQGFLYDFRLGLTFTATVDTFDTPILRQFGFSMSADGSTIAYSTVQDVLDHGTRNVQVYTLPVADLEQQSARTPAGVSVTASDTSPSVGETVTFIATVDSNGTRPTGTVRFLFPFGAVACAEVELTAQAPYTATCSHVIPPPTDPPGVYGGDFFEDMFAIYSGDDISTPSYNFIRVQPYKAPTTIQLQVNPSQPQVGDSVTFTVTLNEFGSAGLPEGWVQFTVDTTLDAGTVISADQTATCNPLSGLGQGTHTVHVLYFGDNFYSRVETDFSFEVG